MDSYEEYPWKITGPKQAVYLRNEDGQYVSQKRSGGQRILAQTLLNCVINGELIGYKAFYEGDPRRIEWRERRQPVSWAA